MKNKRGRVAVFGVFTALALIFSYVELLIPINFGIPGAKLGLANLVIIIVLYKTDWKEALLLSVVRIVLAGFLFGNLFGILYSLAGGILSLAVMALLKRSGAFSIIGVSMAGGVSHNVGQLIMAMLVVETYAVGYYLPVLLIAGLITGTSAMAFARQRDAETAFPIPAVTEPRISEHLKKAGKLIASSHYISVFTSAAVEENKAIVDVGGIGYGVFMSSRGMK